MITAYRKDRHGHFQNEWLDSRHHFSFGEYYNPQRRKFGALRVINDDTIKAGTGFGKHPHNNMEIITYVRSGAVIHQDSLGNEGRTEAGDVQVMSAGTGIEHAEFSAPDQDTTLFQIWLYPREKNITPRWDQARFPKEPVTDKLKLLVSGDAKDTESGALYIHQDAAIYGGHLTAGTVITHDLSGPAYLVMSEGVIEAGNATLEKGDGAEITDESTITLQALEDSELLLITMARL